MDWIQKKFQAFLPLPKDNISFQLRDHESNRHEAALHNGHIRGKLVVANNAAFNAHLGKARVKVSCAWGEATGEIFAIGPIKSKGSTTHAIDFLCDPVFLERAKEAGVNCVVRADTQIVSIELKSPWVISNYQDLLPDGDAHIRANS
jgi:hypothetical protein